MDKWIKKTSHTHACKHTGILLRHKKEENLAIYNNMGKLGWHYAKWNKPDRERHTLYDLIHMWNLIKMKRSNL